MMLAKRFLTNSWQAIALSSLLVGMLVWDGGVSSKWQETTASFLNNEHEHGKLLPGLKVPDDTTLLTNSTVAKGHNLTKTASDTASIDKHFIAKRFSFEARDSSMDVEAHIDEVQARPLNQRQSLEALLDQQAAALSASEVAQKWNGMSHAAKVYMLSMVPNGHPLAEFKGISSSFGFRTHPITGLRQMHSGLDYRGERGDDILATADGLVDFSNFSEGSGFGNLVTIMHANGFETRYGHLKRSVVKVGDYVRKGQKIGEMGNTGRSSGVHLHYEVVFVERRIDPSPFGEWTLTNFDTVLNEVKDVPWHGLNQFVENRVTHMQTRLAFKSPLLIVK
ncbi:M23 family metallopeptidase [Thiomicrorhabdus aquaedulcis]|uniref:M23 family metallopeptidase n=1 Tax=Thiomicrorhabdus aquaedulcis TaxID=2211106 RepID=UPI000FD6BD4E|nr:M23 family metallopeptidase [Thiomicrorhabdus aquaedulcis]